MTEGSAQVVEVTIDDRRWGPLTFDVRTDGPAGATPVVLLHGFPQTSRCWDQVAPLLAAGGRRVFAPDQRGYSPGARPEPTEAYRIDALVGDVLALADALGLERFHLVGHDWGALVAWTLAVAHPERLASLVSLSVPHPRAFADALSGDLAADSDQADRSGYVAFFRSDGAAEAMLADDAAGLKLLYAAAGLSNDEAAPHLEAMAAPGALHAALEWYCAGELGQAGLGDVEVPTAYLWSTADLALGREGAEATERYVRGPYRFVVLEGVDHWIPDHAPTTVAEEILAWTDQHR